MITWLGRVSFSIIHCIDSLPAVVDDGWFEWSVWNLNGWRVVDGFLSDDWSMSNVMNWLVDVCLLSVDSWLVSVDCGWLVWVDWLLDNWSRVVGWLVSMVDLSSNDWLWDGLNDCWSGNNVLLDDWCSVCIVDGWLVVSVVSWLSILNGFVAIIVDLSVRLADRWVWCVDILANLTDCSVWSSDDVLFWWTVFVVAVVVGNGWCVVDSLLVIDGLVVNIRVLWFCVRIGFAVRSRWGCVMCGNNHCGLLVNDTSVGQSQSGEESDELLSRSNWKYISTALEKLSINPARIWISQENWISLKL